ncbi:FAD binding domain-containing protein [Anaeroselena agilis]|uniref:Xanthine dehydrogenase family protein subunit M n=1 Tax=Anaeroselena agilis TaxID=3063788 RepID=A0ABU3P0P5_9FIRM|nr:xanthine dehydrogenase family protein subunit M [Selenomonadales bacterium 4137-cl]
MLTDSKILAADFEYVPCSTVREALDCLASYREKAKVLAGGTDLLVKMKTGVLRCDYLIDIRNAGELRYLRAEADGLNIGALTSLAEIQASGPVKERYSALYEAVRSMAAPAVRNMGTIGGNLGNASPAADTAPPLLVFDATVTLAGTGGERTLPLAEFFTGPGQTMLAADELITAVKLATPADDTGSSFLKLGRVAADIAKINVAVLLERDGDVCRRCRVAFGSVGPTPLRLPAVEAMLAGREATTALFEAAAQAAAGLIKPIDDRRSTGDYRRQVSAVMLEEALAAAWRRAGGDAR